MKVCTRCGEEKPLYDFYEQKLASGNIRRMSHCKECHKEYSNARLNAMNEEERADYYEKMRARQILLKYKLTLEQYENLLKLQGGVCAICRLPETALDNRWTGEGTRTRRLAVDHNHETGKVRGLLCMMCNTRLGYFENLGIFPNLLDYLVEKEEV